MNNKSTRLYLITKAESFVLVALAACLFLAACSNKSTYESIQNDGLRECNQMVDETLRAECLTQHQMPYKDYEQERKRLKGNDEK